MASSLRAPCSFLFCLALWPLLLVVVGVDAAGGAAPAPAPEKPTNLTGILVKGGQFSSFLRLLNATQIGMQIENQLNDSHSHEGLTVFAPTDNAFNNLKAGTLNGLSAQEQVQLMLFHVLPRFYSFDMFQTASNPVRTQAADAGGVYTLNVTGTNNQANVSTGVVETRIDTALYATFPLAVYPVDSVLLPYSLFGAKPPAAAPPPGSAAAAAAGSKVPSTPAAGGPAAAASSRSAASMEGRRVGWAAAALAMAAGVAAAAGLL